MALTILLDEDWVEEHEEEKPLPKRWERFVPPQAPKRGRKPSRHVAKTKYVKQYLVPHDKGSKP